METTRYTKPRFGTGCDRTGCDASAVVTVVRKGQQYTGDRDTYTVRHSWCWDHDPRMVYVNTYREHMAWGGPEEGGWHYPVGTPMGTIRCDNPDEARALCVGLWNGIDTDRADGRSYPGESRVIAMVERTPARAYPKVRPHYE